jgi:hypothetical protein
MGMGMEMTSQSGSTHVWQLNEKAKLMRRTRTASINLKATERETQWSKESLTKKQIINHLSRNKIIM